MLFAVLALLLATPANFGAQINAAQPVDIVQLQAGAIFGNCPVKNIAKAAPGVMIDASQAAHVGQIGFYNASGFTLSGGTLVNGVLIQQGSSNITVKDAHFTNTGVGLQDVSHVTLTGNVFHVVNDSVDVVSSQFVDIERNQCVVSAPSAGHADCVQVWQLAGHSVSSDITIAWNTAAGYLQGFDGDGSPLTMEGTARVSIHDNVYAGMMKTAGGFQPCSSCQMANNVAFTLTATAPGTAPGWAIVCAPYGAGAVMAVPCAPANAPVISGNVNGPTR